MKNHKIRAIFYDEEESFKTLDESYYKQIGIVTFFTKNYLQSLSILESRNIHLVIINVGDFISLHSLNLIKYLSRSEYKNIPIILTGVRMNDDLRKKATEAGVALVVDLPIAKESFIRKIKLLLSLPSRKYERLIPSSVIRYCFKINNISYEGVVYNVSMSGMKIGLDKIVEMNKSVEVSLYLSTINKPMKVACQIVRVSLCKQNDRHWSFSVGMKFTRFMGSAQDRLQYFLEEESDLNKEELFYK